jgi:mono/diheme cytochrome c family protein
MCAGCHGAPGVQPMGISKGLNPEPPDLADAVSDQSDAEIFWVVKNGIKMTGMPAYGASNDDNRIWEIVAFVHLLPKMTAEQYQEYKNRLGQEEHR